MNTAPIQPGLRREEQQIVEPAHTASHLGSGDVRVLASPMMILFMEITARNLLAENLPMGLSSVGMRVDIRHLAPSAVGATIRTTAQIDRVDGRKIEISVEAWDGETMIGAGKHWRYIIDEAKFLGRIQKQP